MNRSISAAQAMQSATLVRVFRSMAEARDVSHLAAALEHAIIWVTDAGGSIEFVNRAYCEFFGMLDTSKRNPGVRAIEIESVRFLTPDVAIVDGGYTAGQNERPLWTTLIVKREPQGWRIAAIRSSAPAR